MQEKVQNVKTKITAKTSVWRQRCKASRSSSSDTLFTVTPEASTSLNFVEEVENCLAYLNSLDEIGKIVSIVNIQCANWTCKMISDSMGRITPMDP
jgi:hypothetical protein